LEITVELIKQLRAATGAGVLDCRKALEATQGDLDEAIAHLRKKGLAAAAKKMGREASEGLVEAYAHPGGRVAVLVEVNCETDFVARTDQFQAFVHDIALHVAAMSPLYMAPEDVPLEHLEREKEKYRRGALQEGKPERIVERIVKGRLKKFYTETCLVEQPFVKDDGILIKDLVIEKIAELKENIVIRRFVRYELGQHVDEPSGSPAPNP
jgi:elongation factor Ts